MREARAARPPRDLVIFGGGGDLALRMLLPSLAFLSGEGRLPPCLRVHAVGRTPETRDDYLRRAEEALLRHAPAAAVGFSSLAGRIDYRGLDATDPEALRSLAAALDPDPVFFLATSPTLYSPICRAIGEAALGGGGARIVLEKPIGRDLESSRAINAAVADVFDEDRVFRIDHYLGKETVQNLIALRFGNALFEPLWNNLSIDHVQITVAETEGVGERWPYYDEYGALRDMLQNHMLQLLCLVAMEPPSDLEPDSVRNEKVKVLRSLRPIGRAEAATTTARGQYAAGVIDGAATRSYAEERGAETGTETFVALQADIDNWRWAGTPFFLRTGKRLPERRTEIVIQFKAVPHSIFSGAGAGDLTANRLVIRLQPEEDVQLLLMNKTPGLDREMRLTALPLSLSHGPSTPRRRIAYERLLLDALDGVSTLFVRRDEVEEAWAWVDGVAEAWAETQATPKRYAAGSWGPPGAFSLLARQGRDWRD